MVRVSLVLGLFALCLTGARAEEVTIGAVAPLTGPAANSGVSLQQGMQLAIDEYNAAPSPKHKVRIQFEDSQSRPEIAVGAGQKLITRDGAKLLIGEAFHSHVTMAMMELAPQFNVPVLSAEPVSSEIAKKVRSNPDRYKLYWKGDLNSDAYGHATRDTIQWLMDKNGFKPARKTIAFVIEDTDYGRSNAQQIAELMKPDGWSVAATEAVPLGYTDFYPQLSKLRADPPAVIVTVFTAVNSGVAFVRQFSEQGLSSLHFAIFYPRQPEFFAQAGSVADGLLWTPMQLDPKNVPKHREFDAKIRKAFNREASASHAYGYCVMKVALDALDKAPSLEPAPVAEAIGKTDLDCVIGHWQFNQDDHSAKAGPDFIPLPTAQVEKGQSAIIWPEKAAGAGVGYKPQPWLR